MFTVKHKSYQEKTSGDIRKAMRTALTICRGSPYS